MGQLKIGQILQTEMNAYLHGPFDDHIKGWFKTEFFPLTCLCLKSNVIQKNLLHIKNETANTELFLTLQMGNLSIFCLIHDHVIWCTN